MDGVRGRKVDLYKCQKEVESKREEQTQKTKDKRETDRKGKKEKL